MTRLTLTAAFLLAACVQLTQADESTLAPDFTKMDWQLSRVDGAAPGYSATLNLGEAGRITGQAPCNRYFADLVQDGTAFHPGPIGATRMACLQIEGEAAYFTLLSGIEKADHAPGTLTLTGAGHEMVFLQPID